ncbi:MAG: GDP-L-fucose synthase [Candidatus Anoxychlamydiales bacterium]|nr:GDP-L-fucose synthase [Candidatus Anoxychlamydiales bacterium]
MNLEDKILITGANGLVGSNLTEVLKKEGYDNLVTVGRKDCDLLNLENTVNFFKIHKPKFVFHLAAEVYGIMGNMKNKGKSFFNNILLNTHVIEASKQINVNKIIAMGSGCVYPYPQPSLPLKESMVFLGEPHFSEDSYAHAKRAMLAHLKAYKESYDMNYAFVISGNLYGPNDKFDIENGHVIPSLIAKFYEAKKNNTKITVWGNGLAKRDFLYAKDVAKALIKIANEIEGPVNMGSGMVSNIKDIVFHLAKYLNIEDKVVWDSSMPNGQDHREYDLSKLFSVGFKPMTDLQEGLIETFDWYSNNLDKIRN